MFSYNTWTTINNIILLQFIKPLMQNDAYSICKCVCVCVMFTATSHVALGSFYIAHALCIQWLQSSQVID